jgi:dihydrofolate reductase
MIHIIVAMDTQTGIGIQGRLPWHIPQDLALFKELTLHKTVVMGRKTFESIGKALPKRMNYVVTRNSTQFQECLNLKILTDYPAFLEAHRCSEEDIFIIGGSEIYKLALPYAQHIYVSHISGVYHCDTFFPSFDLNSLHCVETRYYDAFKFCHYVQEQTCDI